MNSIKSLLRGSTRDVPRIKPPITVALQFSTDLNEKPQIKVWEGNNQHVDVLQSRVNDLQDIIDVWYHQDESKSEDLENLIEDNDEYNDRNGLQGQNVVEKTRKALAEEVVREAMEQNKAKKAAAAQSELDALIRSYTNSATSGSDSATEKMKSVKDFIEKNKNLGLMYDDLYKKKEKEGGSTRRRVQSTKKRKSNKKTSKSQHRRFK